MSNFTELSAMNVSEHAEKKGQFTYLSWAWAHDYLAKKDPEFNWWLHDFQNESGVTQPYMASLAGCFVRVSVLLFGKTVTHTYPVLNHANNSISAAEVTSFDINHAQMRCFAKCCALHGLGLYIYAGEDLPGDLDVTDVPATDIVVDFGKYKGMGVTVGQLATNCGHLGLAYLKLGATTDVLKNPVMKEKFAEVWKLHAEPLSDSQITEYLQDITDESGLKALKSLLTDEQTSQFEAEIEAITNDIKEAA